VLAWAAPGERVAEIVGTDPALLDAGQDEGSTATLDHFPARRIDQASCNPRPTRLLDRMDVDWLEVA